MNIINYSAVRISKSILDGTLDAEDIVFKFIERLRTIEAKGLNAFVTVFDDDQINMQIEDIRSKDTRNLFLLGVPIAIKSNIAIADTKTNCGSAMLKDYISPFDSSVIRYLRDAGAVIVGNTNMDEFAMGNSTETSYFGPTLNPWSSNRVPGGSSGGSAAAVAIYEAPISLGTDTGGSIRLPAAYTYTLGIKPTYGFVSRYGLIAYAESLEQIGPFSKTAQDLALLLYVISEYDPMDITLFNTSVRTSLREELLSFAYSDSPHIDINNLKIAIPKNAVEKSNDLVKKSFYNALDRLASNGAVVEDVEIPVLDATLASYYIIAMVEASSNLARFAGVNFGSREKVGTYLQMIMETRAKYFGQEVKNRIMAGTFASMAGYQGKYYLKALKIRSWLIDEFSRLFKKYDVIAIPTAPDVPPRFGESLSVAGYVYDIYTTPVNIAGVPAISIPIDLIDRKLPIGLQMIGNYYSDAKLIKIAYFMEGKFYDPRKIPDFTNVPRNIKPEDKTSELTSNSEISDEIIENVAYFARIKIKKREIPTYRKYFESVLELFNQVDLFMKQASKYEATFHPLHVSTTLRQDKIMEEGKKGIIQQIAPELTDDKYVKIPRLH